LGRIYSEWEELLNAYKGYLEEGQVDYAVEEIKKFSRERMALLTQRRMELLFELGSLRVESINDLAKKVRRNVKNVHQDLSVLRGLGFVRVSHRRGKALVPETLVKEITFIIR
jgi:predicted transcriptional regulator